MVLRKPVTMFNSSWSALIRSLYAVTGAIIIIGYTAHLYWTRYVFHMDA